MAGPEPRPLPTLTDLAAQIAQIQAAVIQLQQVAGAVVEQLRRPPIHLTVEHMDVQTLEFRLDSIDVDSLSGELNIGMTSKLTAAAPGAAPAPPPAAEPPAATADQSSPTPVEPDPAQPKSHLLWPGGPENRPEKEAESNQ